MTSFVTKSQQEEAAIALLQLCGSPDEAYKILAKSTPLSMQAPGASNEANNVSIGRTSLSSKAQPFAPSQEGHSGWANTFTTTYLVEQSPPLGSIPAVPIAPGDRNNHYPTMPSEGKWSFRQEEVEKGQRDVRVRCSRCGAHIPVQSRFCDSCGAPITGGMHCSVHKHASMGIAIVSLRDVRVRDAILRAGCVEIIEGIKVELRPHKDRVTKEEVLTDIFVAWGHKVEKATPLSEHDIAKFFDQKHVELADKGEGEWMACKSTTCGGNSSLDDKDDWDSISDYTATSRGRQKEDAHSSTERWPSRTPSPPRAGLHLDWDFPAAAWDANGPKATAESSAIFAACVPLEVAAPPQVTAEAASIFAACVPLEADVEDGQQFPPFEPLQTTPPLEEESGPCNAKVLPVKHTFIHYSEGPPCNEADISLPDGDETRPLKSLSRSTSAPGLMMENPVFALISEEPEEPEEPEAPKEPEELKALEGTLMWELHSRGSCSPCAYFHEKEDSCRQGAQCKFCHLCPPGALKKLKKYKRQKARVRQHSHDGRMRGRWVFIRD